MVRLLLDNGANVNARTKHVSLHTSGLLACQDSPIASGATMHVQDYMTVWLAVSISLRSLLIHSMPLCCTPDCQQSVLAKPDRHMIDDIVV